MAGTTGTTIAPEYEIENDDIVLFGINVITTWGRNDNFFYEIKTIFC